MKSTTGWTLVLMLAFALRRRTAKPQPRFHGLGTPDRRSGRVRRQLSSQETPLLRFTQITASCTTSPPALRSLPQVVLAPCPGRCPAHRSLSCHSATASWWSHQSTAGTQRSRCVGQDTHQKGENSTAIVVRGARQYLVPPHKRGHNAGKVNSENCDGCGSPDTHLRFTSVNRIRRSSVRIFTRLCDG